MSLFLEIFFIASNCDNTVVSHQKKSHHHEIKNNEQLRLDELSTYFSDLNLYKKSSTDISDKDLEVLKNAPTDVVKKIIDDIAKQTLITDDCVKIFNHIVKNNKSIQTKELKENILASLLERKQNNKNVDRLIAPLLDNNEDISLPSNPDILDALIIHSHDNQRFTKQAKTNIQKILDNNNYIPKKTKTIQYYIENTIESVDRSNKSFLIDSYRKFASLRGYESDTDLEQFALVGLSLFKENFDKNNSSELEYTAAFKEFLTTYTDAKTFLFSSNRDFLSQEKVRLALGLQHPKKIKIKKHKS